MARFFLLMAAISGLLAVVLGAFGAHALSGSLDSSLLSTFQTAVQYQFYHSLALLAVALFLLRPVNTSLSRRLLIVSGLAFAAGIVLFSGSLYSLALGGPSWLGPVTPVGGLSFMVGWLCLLVWAWRLNDAR